MSLDLPIPTHFPAFPYDPPYSIQQKKVTIVESPTGTGKTLSLLCASMTWLIDDRDRAKKGKLKEIVGEAGGARDWVIEQSIERERREIESQRAGSMSRDWQEARAREARMKKMAQARTTKRMRRVQESPANPQDLADDDFLPESNDDSSQKEGEMVDKTSGRGSVEEQEPTCTKIYYASRTHSQLSQVLPELQKLKIPDSDATVPWDASRKRPLEIGDEHELQSPCSRTVSLGSRKQLCINDELRAVSRDLDESCREMLNESDEKKCPYLPPTSDEERMFDFRDQILATPKDIEDLAEAGRLSGSIPQAELVTLPYNLLLQQNAREALGIDLTNHIVIVDEAHNLISTLLSLSTVRLPYGTLATALQQLAAYISRFRTRLSGIHLVHLKRLLVFLDALKQYALEWKESKIVKSEGPDHNSAKRKGSNSDLTEVMTISEFMERLGRKASSINFLEIEKYLKTSKVARKVSGYAEKQAEKADSNSTRRKGAIPPLSIVEEFMLSLTGASEDGRVSISLVGAPEKLDVEMKYQQLNPSPRFMEVIETARSVILAGGTMSPISDVINQLFPTLSCDKVTSFSCGHVIPETSLRALVVTKSPRGEALDYKAGRLGDASVIDDLGQILFNFACVIPAGLIVFFPSYSFLRAVKAAWLKNGKLDKLRDRKEVFFEPDDSKDVEKVLTEYASAVHRLSSTESKKTGSLLLAVVGAKLSEGLNFADDLARAVIVVGLPFANLGSSELQERLKYVKQQGEKRDATSGAGITRKDAGTELYENMCLNAVNQCIGRAIRHKGDWASLILLDQRYASGTIRAKLPKWIGSRLLVTETFGQAMKELGIFYRNKRGI
ncbi:helicase C-terminal domain-containing protein [Amanita rubescens]|nr:helicase C-terminal domain-containing protein [Amanita rubescens]